MHLIATEVVLIYISRKKAFSACETVGEMGGGDVMLDSCSCRPSEKILFGVLQDHQELPPETLQPLLDQVWGLHGRFRITHSLGKKFVFHFDTKEERDLVLENAPWAVDGMVSHVEAARLQRKG